MWLRPCSAAAALMGLLLALGPAKSVGDAIKIGGMFREYSKGWGSTHAAAAAVAVYQINADPTILPRDRLELETVDLLDKGGVRGWGVTNLISERATDPMKSCWVSSLLGLDRMANITAILGPGYSADLDSVSQYVMPYMPTKDILLMTQGAAASKFADKTRFPHVSRMCHSNEDEAVALVDIVADVVQHTSFRLVHCNDSYCRDCKDLVEQRARERNMTSHTSQYLSSDLLEDNINLDASNTAHAALMDQMVEQMVNCDEKEPTTAVVLCSHPNEVNSIMKSAHEGCGGKCKGYFKHTIWVTNMWGSNDLDRLQTLDMDTSAPTILSFNRRTPQVGDKLDVCESRPSGEQQACGKLHNLKEYWESLRPYDKASFSGFDLEAGLDALLNDDQWLKFTYDAVYALAFAFESMHRRSLPLNNASALKETLKQISFYGVSDFDPVEFDQNLERKKGSIEVLYGTNFNTSTWRVIGKAGSKGLLLDPNLGTADDGIKWPESPNVPAAWKIGTAKPKPLAVCPHCPDGTFWRWQIWRGNVGGPCCKMLKGNIYAFTFLMVMDFVCALFFARAIALRIRLNNHISTKFFYGLRFLVCLILVIIVCLLGYIIHFEDLPGPQDLLKIVIPNAFCPFWPLIMFTVFAISMVGTIYYQNQGWWMYHWITVNGKTWVDTDRSQHHALEWRIFRNDALKHTAIMSAMPKCLKNHYEFHRLLYYRDRSWRASTSDACLMCEIVFDVSLKNDPVRKKFYLKLLCTPGRRGFSEVSNMLAREEEMAALFAGDSTTREPDSAHLLIPTSMGYVSDLPWNDKVGGRSFSLSAVAELIQSWLTMLLNDSSLYFIESELSIKYRDESSSTGSAEEGDRFQTLAEKMREEPFKVADAFRISLSMAQLLSRLKEENILLYNLDPDTIVQDEQGVYWITDWSHAIWNPVRIKMTFAGMSEKDFHEEFREKLRTCIAEQLLKEVGSENKNITADKKQLISQFVKLVNIRKIQKTLQGTQTLISIKAEDKSEASRRLSNLKDESFISKLHAIKPKLCWEREVGGLEKQETNAEICFASSIVPFFLVWKEVGKEKPKTGTEICHKELKEDLVGALQKKCEPLESKDAVFERQEWLTLTQWDKDKIFQLSSESYIEVGGTYFKPASRDQKYTRSDSLTRKFEGSISRSISFLAEVIPTAGKWNLALPATSRSNKILPGEEESSPKASTKPREKAIYGAPASIAPELLPAVVDPSSADVDPSDSAEVYSLGVFMYRLLTSNYPYFNIKSAEKKIKDLLEHPCSNIQSGEKRIRLAKLLLTITKEVQEREAMFDRTVQSDTRADLKSLDVEVQQPVDRNVDNSSDAQVQRKVDQIETDFIEALQKISKAPTHIFFHALERTTHDNNGIFLHKLYKHPSLGLKWNDVGSSKPTKGIEMKDDQLHLALERAVTHAAKGESKVEIQKEEWEGCQIADLSHDSYIKVGNTHYAPAAQEYEISSGDQNDPKLSIVEKGKQAWELKLSPKLEITFSAQARHYASIDEEVQKFAFCYPSHQPIQGVDDESALARLLREGGFVYFDNSCQIKSIMSIQWGYSSSLLFDSLDVDGDATLERTELDILKTAGWATDRIDLVFNALDVDCDGSISRIELQHFLDKIGEKEWREKSLLFIRLGLNRKDATKSPQDSEKFDLSESSQLHKVHRFTKIQWICPNLDDPNNGGGTFLFEKEGPQMAGRQTILCPLWMGYLDWEGLPQTNLTIDAQNLIVSMLQMDGKKRPGQADVRKCLEGLVMMHELLDHIGKKKEEMQDILKKLPEDLKNVASNLGNSIYPKAEEHQGFSREISDLFDQAQGIINEQQFSSQRDKREKLEKEIKQLLCKQHMDKANEPCICRQHQQPLPPCPSQAALSPPGKKFHKKRLLEFGKSEEATKGLKDFIGLSDDQLFHQIGPSDDQLLHQGVRAMQNEFIQHGSLQDLENFYYICHGIAQHKPDMPAHVKDDIDKGCYHGGNLEDGEYDYEHNGLKLRDFVFHKHSQGCDLSEAHVLAVRIYTTSSYPKLNRPLRNRPVVPGKTRFLPHPFRMTVYYLDEGLRKLRTVAAKKQYFSDKSLLYRGVYGELNEEELEKSGGIERAPMSTSNQMHTAASYVNAFSSQKISSGKPSKSKPRMIIEFETEGLSTGTSIEYLSVYPTKEAEFLYPPLTRIKLEDRIVITQECAHVLMYIMREQARQRISEIKEQLASQDLCNKTERVGLQRKLKKWEQSQNQMTINIQNLDEVERQKAKDTFLGSTFHPAARKTATAPLDSDTARCGDGGGPPRTLIDTAKALCNPEGKEDPSLQASDPEGGIMVCRMSVQLC